MVSHFINIIVLWRVEGGGVGGPRGKVTKVKSRNYARGQFLGGNVFGVSVEEEGLFRVSFRTVVLLWVQF